MLLTASLLDKATTVADVVPRVLEHLVTKLELAGASFWQLHGDTELRRVHWTHAATDDERGHALVARAHATGSPSVSVDGLGLAFAAHVAGDSLGAILLESATPRAWDDHRLAELDGVGAQLGQFVRRMRAECACCTERNRIHAELAESRRLLDEAQAACRFGTWSRELGEGGRIVCSSGAFHLLDLPEPSSPTVDAFIARVHPDDRARAAAIFDGEVDGEIPFRLLRGDGEVRWLRSVIHVVRDGRGVARRVLGTSQDVTDLQRVVEERDHLAQQFLQAQKMEAVGRLAGGIAHDFNNLLSVINGVGELLVESTVPGDPMREDLDEILAAGRRASTLTRQLLAFSRRQVMQPRPVDLGVLARESEKMLRRLIGEDVALELHSDEALGAVMADPAQIDQVLMNLAVNARDAMPRGGCLTITTRNVILDEDFARTHAFVAPGPYVMLAMRDTGVGMDEATRSRIFEPFFTTKEKGKGTGLGLSTVYGIVKQSKGTIWVYSEPGQGTVFKLYFPAVDAPALAAHTVPSRGSLAARGETLLLVEDDRQVRAFARRVLEGAGYRVFDAGDGNEAVRIAAERGDAIDLVVSDVVMAGMSGPQVAERIRASRAGMRFLFMSGYTEDTIIHHGVLEANIDFLEKPVVADALLRKVREVLDRRVAPSIQ